MRSIRPLTLSLAVALGTFAWAQTANAPEGQASSAQAAPPARTPTAQPTAQAQPANATTAQTSNASNQPAQPSGTQDTEARQAATNAAQAAQLQVQAQQIETLQAQIQALQNQIVALQSQLAQAQGTANAAQAQLQDQAQAAADAEAARQDRLARIDQSSQSITDAAVLIQRAMPDEAISALGDAQTALSNAAASANRYQSPQEATAEQRAIGAISAAQAQLSYQNGGYAQDSLAQALDWIAQARALAGGA